MSIVDDGGGDGIQGAFSPGFAIDQMPSIKIPVEAGNPYRLTPALGVENF